MSASYRLRCLRDLIRAPAATATTATTATDGPSSGEGVATVATVAVAEPARPRDPGPETPSARREVLERLRANPQITRAFATRWEGDVLIVTLAVRNVGMCDLAIPRERIRDMRDYAELLAVLGNPEGRA